jgi:hypothetical protein
MDERKLSEPILLELVKNAVDAIVDETRSCAPLIPTI